MHYIIKALGKGDLMEKILYWAIRLWMGEIVIPKSTDEACERMIQEYVLKKETEKHKREKKNGNISGEFSRG